MPRALAGLLILVLAACSSASTLPPQHVSVQNVCPLSISSTCGGGGTLLSDTVTLSDGSHSYASQIAPYTAAGRGTSPTGTLLGTDTVSTSSNIYDGSETFAIVYRGATRYLKTVNEWYLRGGTNYLPNGVTLTAGTGTGASSAAFTDSLGRHWSVHGTLAADGHTVNLTFSSASVGTWTTAWDAQYWAPTLLQAMQGTTVQAINWGGVSVTAGLVAAGAGLVAAVAVVIPGGQPVAAAAGIVAAAATVVTASAAYIDYQQKQKANKKQ